MTMQMLVPAAIAMTAVGFFAAAWMHFSKPVRLLNGKSRVEPQA